jgi:hypothetical protein
LRDAWNGADRVGEIGTRVAPFSGKTIWYGFDNRLDIRH